MEFAPEGLTKVDKKASKDKTRPAKHICAHFRNKDHMSIYRVKTHCKSTYTVNVDLQCVNTSDEETIAPQSFRNLRGLMMMEKKRNQEPITLRIRQHKTKPRRGPDSMMDSKSRLGQQKARPKQHQSRDGSRSSQLGGWSPSKKSARYAHTIYPLPQKKPCVACAIFQKKRALVYNI